MTATITIEEEQGTFVGTLHRHNGYYAGDFGWSAAPVDSVPPPLEPCDWS